MTVKELRERLYGVDDNAEVEVITETTYDFHFGGFALQSVIAATVDSPEEKVTRVVLLAE